MVTKEDLGLPTREQWVEHGLNEDDYDVVDAAFEIGAAFGWRPGAFCPGVVFVTENGSQINLRTTNEVFELLAAVRRLKDAN